jgi:hypothetical protein
LAVTYPTGNLIRISDILLSPSGVNFGVPLIFNVLIKDVSDEVTHYRYIHFAGDIRIYKPSNLLKTAIYYSLKINVRKVDALLTYETQYQ